jgi:membrane-bound inhibitor of C-type lysozyme
MLRTCFLIGGLSLSFLLVGFPTEAQPGNSTAQPKSQTVAATQSVDPTLQKALRQEIARYMKAQKVTPDASQRFYTGYIDLNGDRVLDAVVVFSSPDWCGTGGCTMLVFQGLKNKTFRLVSASSLVNPPLTVSQTKTRGWKDLIVDVSGGGMTAKKVALKFDGKKYPLNPSDQPAISANTSIKGTVLFPAGSEPQTLTGTTAQKSPKPVFFTCNNDPANEIVATFFETDPPTVRLERGDTMITATLQPSGSGARYAGQNVSFWNKGNEAMVEWKGEKLQCQTK